MNAEQRMYQLPFWKGEPLPSQEKKKKFVRRVGEFSYDTWRRVIARGVCEECGAELDPQDPWEVHHIIFLGSEAAKQFPVEVLRSIANAELVHRSCHHHLHNMYDEPWQPDVDRVKAKYAEMVAESYRLLQIPKQRRLG